MRWLGVTLLAVSLIPSAIASEAPTGSGNTWKFSAKTGCTEAKRHSGRLNYIELLNAGGACFREKNIVGTTYFLLLSQIRFRIDSELLFPRVEEAKVKRGRFSAYLFYRAGGSGPDEIYRDAKKRHELFSPLKTRHVL